MGWGGFGSNGSVHWKVVHTGDDPHMGYLRGRDPNVVANDPRYGDPKFHVPPGEFKLKFRFAGGAKAAYDALDKARKTVRDEKGYGVLDLVVPGVRRETPPADDAFEITIAWGNNLKPTQAD